MAMPDGSNGAQYPAVTPLSSVTVGDGTTPSGVGILPPTDMGSIAPPPIEAGIAGGFDTAPYAAPFGAIPQVSAVNQMPATPMEKTAQSILYLPPLVIGDFLNTVASSVGLVSKDALKNALPHISKSLSDYYDSNRDAVALIGEGAGMFIPGIAATKVLRAGSILGDLIEGVPGAGLLLQNESRVAKALEALSVERGAAAASEASIAPATLLNSPAAREYMWQQVLNGPAGIKSTMAFEIGVAATMNQSDVLFPQDATLLDYATMYGASVLLGPGMEALSARKLIARSVRESGAVAQKLAGDGLNTNMIVSSPDGRDLTITAFNYHANALQAAIESSPPGENAGRRTITNAAKTVDENAIYGENGELSKFARDNTLPIMAPSFTMDVDTLQTVRRAARQDPGIMLGAKALGPLPDNTLNAGKAMLDAQKEQADSLRGQADALLQRVQTGKVSNVEKLQLQQQASDLQAKASAVDSLQGFVVRGGDVMPITSNVASFMDNAVNMNLVKESAGANGLEVGVQNFYNKLLGGNVSASVDQNFMLTGNAYQRWLKTDPVTRSMIYHLNDRMMQTLGRQKSDPFSTFQITLTKNAPWQRMEAIKTALDRGVITPRAIQFEKGMNETQLDALITKAKFKDFVELMDTNQKLANAGTKGMSAAVKSPYEVRSILNLPAAQYGNPSPLESWFQGLYASGITDIDNMVGSTIRDSLATMRKIPDGLTITGEDTAFQGGAGSLWRGDAFNTEAQMHPFVMWKADLTPMSFEKGILQQQIVNRNMEIRGKLLGDYYDAATGRMMPAADSYVTRLAQQLTDSPAFAESQMVDTLTYGDLRGQGIMNQQSFASRDSLTMQAAYSQWDNANRTLRSQQKAVYEAPIVGSRSANDIIGDLVGSQNEASRISFAQYAQSHDQGWFTLPGARKTTTSTGAEVWQLVLDHDNLDNQAWFRQRFGREIQKGDLLPQVRADGQYQPLGITPLAWETAQMASGLGEQLRVEQSKLLQTNGQMPLKRKENWIPPRFYGSKPMSYIMDLTDGGRVIHTLMAPTAKGLADLEASAEVKALLERTGGLIVRPDDVKEYAHMTQRAYYEPADVSDPRLSVGRSAKGGGADINPGSAMTRIQEMMRSFDKQWENITKDTISKVYEPQLSYAERASVVWPTPKGILKNPVNVFDRYKDTLMGTPAIERDQMVGTVYNRIETFIGNILKTEWAMTNGLGMEKAAGAGIKKVLQRAGIMEKDATKYERISQQLGQFNPFNSTAEMMASRFDQKLPDTMKHEVSLINHITTFLTLRAFDLGQVLTTGFSNLAVLPAVVRALQKTAGETEAEWRARTHFFGSVIPSKVGEPLGIWNQTRAMANGLHYMWSSASAADRDFAKTRGMFRQPIAEINDTIAKSWTSNKVVDAFRKVSDVMGTPADKAEDWAREHAHMTGVFVARKLLGMTDMEGVHAFARQVANQAIGDYTTANRPIMFQGGPGMAVGLFQTYMWNYGQRLFSYIENKQYRALATQYFMQSALFGAKSLPGWDQFTAMFANNNSGRDSPTDTMERRLGPFASDMLLYGTLSNIPRLFGANDGVAIYTRANQNFRAPPALSEFEIPVWSQAVDLYHGIGDAVDQFRVNGGYSPEQVLEAASHATGSRLFQRLSELVSGVAVDRQGEVISDHVHTTMSYISRGLALKPLSEAKEIDALQRERETALSQFAKREILTQQMRAAVRGGELDGDMIGNAFMQYAQTGGDPAYFPRYLESTMLTASMPKAQQHFLDEIQSNAKIQDAIRLMNSGIIDNPAQ